jgi:heme-degrading monooxygenase HmoA
MLVAITRLRIRSWRVAAAFAVQALRSARQAKVAQGNVGVTLLAEAHRTFWTRTIWTDEAAMRAFMRAGAHRSVMVKLADWCDEAAVVHWLQNTPAAPAWEEAWQRLQREGRSSPINYPTKAHVNFRIAAPRVSRFGELRLK